MRGSCALPAAPPNQGALAEVLGEGCPRTNQRSRPNHGHDWYESTMNMFLKGNSKALIVKNSNSTSKTVPGFYRMIKLL